MMNQPLQLGHLMPYKMLNIISHDSGVSEVILDSPKEGNPLSPVLWKEIEACFTKLSDDPSIRVILIRTEKKHFSYGLDLVEAAPLILPAVQAGAAGEQQLIELGEELQRSLGAIANASQPVIAAIQGWCIGAGLELAAACDIRLCSSDAKFSLREVKVGMVSDLGGIQRLAYVLNEGHLREMAFTGGNYSADWAHKNGLVNDVYETPVLLREKAFELATKIANNPPRVVKDIKIVMNARTQATIKQGLQDALEKNSTLMQMEDFQEAIAAFFEQRKPIFKGK